MRYIVETRTAVAAIAIGDPTLLGSLRKASGMAEARAELSTAVASGALWRTDTGSDGSYLVHVFVDEEPSGSIRGFLQDPLMVDRFRVPSGRLLVAGEEEFVGPERGREQPAIGRELDISPGEYLFTAYRVDLPQDTLMTLFTERASAVQLRAWSLANQLPLICILISLAALVVGAMIYARTSSMLALSLLAIPGAAWWLAARFRTGTAYREAEALLQVVERELPSVVVVLRKYAVPCQSGGPTPSHRSAS